MAQSSQAHSHERVVDSLLIPLIHGKDDYISSGFHQLEGGALKKESQM